MKIPGWVFEFLEENEELLENNQFEELYAKLNLMQRTILTQAFALAGIDPLPYMTSIVMGYSKDNNNLIKLDIPSNIQTIDEHAFEYCESLKEINFGNNVRIIDNSAFLGCYNLKTLKLPRGLEELNYEAFGRCFSLESIWIPKSLKYIGDDVFYADKKIKYIYYEGTEEEWEQIRHESDYWGDGRNYIDRSIDPEIHFNVSASEWRN